MQFGVLFTKSRRGILGWGAVGASSLAFAVSQVWPFMMAPYFPSQTFENDRDNNEFQSAQVLPQMIMNTSVGAIKAGDIVRVQYPDGRVFDFPVVELKNCTVKSTGCKLGKPVQKSGPSAAAEPTDLQIDRATFEAIERENCFTGRALNPTRRVSVNTGYWGSYGYASGSTVTVVGTWVSTGTYTYTIGATVFNDRYRRMCL